MTDQRTRQHSTPFNNIINTHKITPTHKNGQAHMDNDPTPSPIPHGYVITAYTLIIERRHCDTCGSEFEAPAHALRVAISHYRTEATKTIALPDLKLFYNQLPKQVRREFSSPVLPRSIRYVDTDVPFCQHCFTATTPDQPDLFAPTQQLLTPQEVRRMRAARQQLVEEYGREPTAAELKQQAKKKVTKPAPVPVGTLDLTQFMK